MFKETRDGMMEQKCEKKSSAPQTALKKAQTPLIEPPAITTAKKLVIVIRHGDDAGPELSELGIEQIRKSAKEIESMLMGKNISILSSPTGRTQHSAKILCEVLNVKKAGVEMLLDVKRYGMTDFKSLMQSILKSPTEVVILVTHQTNTNSLSEILFHGNRRTLMNAGYFKAEVDPDDM